MVGLRAACRVGDLCVAGLADRRLRLQQIQRRGRGVGAAGGNAGTAFIGINAFHHTGAGSQWLNRFADAAREAAARNRDYAIAVARAQVIGQALTEFTVLATMCVGIVLVLEGLMNAGGLVAALMLIWRITTPAQQAFGSLVRLRQVRNSAAQLDQLMMTPRERRASTSPAHASPVRR